MGIDVSSAGRQGGIGQALTPAAVAPAAVRGGSASGTAGRPGARPVAHGFAGVLKGKGAKAVGVKGQGSGSLVKEGGMERGVGVRQQERSGSASGGEGEGGSEGGSEGGGEGVRGDRAAGNGEEWLDPAARHVAMMGPPVMVGREVQASASEGARGRSLEELLPALVRRIAWAGDRNKGTVRMEIGAGAYAGMTVIVHADGGRVRVELGGSDGPDLERLRERLDARLRGHGLDVESVT